MLDQTKGLLRKHARARSLLPNYIKAQFFYFFYCWILCSHVCMYMVCVYLWHTCRDRETRRKPQRSCCLHCPQFGVTDVCSRPCPVFLCECWGFELWSSTCLPSKQSHPLSHLSSYSISFAFVSDFAFLTPWEEWGRWYDLNVSPPHQFYMLELNPWKYVSNLKGSILERWLDCKTHQE